jgi:hypothetical protein
MRTIRRTSLKRYPGGWDPLWANMGDEDLYPMELSNLHSDKKDEERVL